MLNSSDIWTWSLDVKITVACAVVSTLMAILQLIAAAVALRAAWKIAADQQIEADRIRQASRADFIAVVSSLAQEALVETDKAEKALRVGADPSGILYNFSQRLADLHEALQPIRSASPPDAKLMLAVGRLSREFQVTEADGLDTQTAIQRVAQHRGSIGLALIDIQPSPVPGSVVVGDQWQPCETSAPSPVDLEARV